MKSKNLIEDKQSVFHHFCDFSKYLRAEIWALRSVFNVSLFTLAKFVESWMNQSTPTDILMRFLRSFLTKHAPTLAYGHVLQCVLTPPNRSLKHYFLRGRKFSLGPKHCHYELHLIADLELLFVSPSLPQQTEFVQISWNCGYPVLRISTTKLITRPVTRDYLQVKSTLAKSR